jgi:hypothetical protein
VFSSKCSSLIYCSSSGITEDKFEDCIDFLFWDRKYFELYRGQLVSSLEFLNLFYTEFPARSRWYWKQENLCLLQIEIFPTWLPITVKIFLYVMNNFTSIVQLKGLCICWHKTSNPAHIWKWTFSRFCQSRIFFYKLDRSVFCVLYFTFHFSWSVIFLSHFSSSFSYPLSCISSNFSGVIFLSVYTPAAVLSTTCPLFS